ncbi:hypothetical protein [Methylobacterium sp. Leaf100]|uniref:hypothetical protein n=1 Tax=Methylobacterium sp. Leaf100 TaxID=1736252 RepID=UPI0006FD1DD5|nr:hypothetical protein [Methylobacterium sp. Leaf100]KQP36671.1 hypothetical protein ASF25_01570 [Methylobacterium sp. Leaf100]
MTAPSLIRAALAAPDRAERTRLMADTMRHHEAGPEGACTFHHLMARGFSPAEVEAYRDDARALCTGRPAIVLAAPPGRREGQALVRVARALRKRQAATQQQAGGAA